MGFVVSVRMLVGNGDGYPVPRSACDVYRKEYLTPIVTSYFNERDAVKYNASAYHNALASDLVSFAALQPGDTVLDLATGTGLVARAAAAAVAPTGAVVGIDLSETFLSHARSLPTPGAPITYALGDIETREALTTHRPRPPPTPLDAILCVSTLPYLSSARAAVRLWASVLRGDRGGRGVLAVTGIDTASFVTGAVMREACARHGVELPEWSDDTRDEGACRALLEGAGATDVRVAVREYGAEVAVEEVVAAWDRVEEWGTHPLTRQLCGVVAETRGDIVADYKKLVLDRAAGGPTIWNPNTNFLVVGHVKAD